MAKKFTKIERALKDGLELFGDYLEEKLTALYKIGKKRGKTEFGYLGDGSDLECPDDATEEEERIVEERNKFYEKWVLLFAVINEEYYDRSFVVEGFSYLLEKDHRDKVYVQVNRYKERFDYDIELDDGRGRDVYIYPHSVANYRSLVALLKLIAKELRVNLDNI